MNGRALIAEFVGTFALIFVGVGCIAANGAAGAGGTLVGVALAHGLTIGALVTRKIDAMNAVGYIYGTAIDPRGPGPAGIWGRL